MWQKEGEKEVEEDVEEVVTEEEEEADEEEERLRRARSTQGLDAAAGIYSGVRAPGQG